MSSGNISLQVSYFLSEPVDAVGFGVDTGLLTGDKVGDQATGRRGAGEPIMAVAESEKGLLYTGARSDHRQGVGKARPVTHPATDLATGETGKQFTPLLDQLVGASIVWRCIQTRDLDRASEPQPRFHGRGDELALRPLYVPTRRRIWIGEQRVVAPLRLERHRVAK